MLDAPIFTSPLDTEIAGDDPLGVAPTNERMFGNVFPGVNNVVRYIRVYSLIAWTVGLIEAHLKRNGAEMLPEEAHELSRNALQRIQLAMLWRNSGLKLPQLAGSTRKFPTHNSPQRLTFPDLGTIRADFLDPGAYRPSLTGGLGFLLRDANGKLYACSDAGRALAGAYDEFARGDHRYRWLPLQAAAGYCCSLSSFPLPKIAGGRKRTSCPSRSLLALRAPARGQARGGTATGGGRVRPQAVTGTQVACQLSSLCGPTKTPTAPSSRPAMLTPGGGGRRCAGRHAWRIRPSAQWLGWR